MNSKPTCLTTATTQVYTVITTAKLMCNRLTCFHALTVWNCLKKKAFEVWTVSSKQHHGSLASWLADWSVYDKIGYPSEDHNWMAHRSVKECACKERIAGLSNRTLPAYPTLRVKNILTTQARKGRMLLKSHNKQQSSNPTDITETWKEVDLLLPKSVRHFKQRLCTYLSSHL